MKNIFNEIGLDILNNKILKESQFSNWEYILPKNGKQITYDFYTMVNLNNNMLFSYYNKDNTSSYDYDKIENIDLVYKQEMNSLLKQLKKHLLKVLKMANVSEMGHIYDNGTDNMNTRFKGIIEKFGDNLGNQYIKFLRELYSSLKFYGKDSSDMFDVDETITKSNEERKKRYGGKFKSISYEERYMAIRAALKKVDMDWLEFFELSEYCYNNFKWSSQFGGEKWAKITKAYKPLLEAKTQSELIIMIDHVYDLQHNTGSVFNKIKMYQDNNGEYGWILKFLDMKANIKSPYYFNQELLEKSSEDIKRFSYTYLKYNYGVTKNMLDDAEYSNDKFQEWQEENKKTTPEKQVEKPSNTSNDIFSKKPDEVDSDGNKKWNLPNGGYVVIYKNGDKHWYNKDYQHHRENGPAVEYANGDKFWYINDKYHREDGPAIEWASGTKEWFLNGKRHREDGPACEYADGIEEWYINGKYFTEEEFKKWQEENKKPTPEKQVEKPSNTSNDIFSKEPDEVESNGNKKWNLSNGGYVVVYKNGDKYWYDENYNLHRENGPAIEYLDGSKAWYINNKRHREDGPAVEHSDGSKSWYINDKKLTEEEFKKWQTDNKKKTNESLSIYSNVFYRILTDLE